MKKELTGKQRAFARLMAEGKMSASDCYREAYDTTAKPETVQKLAYRESNKAHVRGWIEHLINLREAASRNKAVSDRDLSLETLRKCINGDIELRSDQVAAVNMLAKASGMYVIKHEDITQQSSDDIAGDLHRKLAELLAVDDIDADASGVTH